MADPIASPEDVTTFWFEETPAEKYFRADPAFDAEIRRRFEATVEAALAGRLDDWAAAPDSALALILVLDQFTRNARRGTPAAFAGDKKALAVCKAALAQGFDASLPPLRALFLIMPLMHSENLADQDRCLELVRPLDIRDATDAAVRHREIISLFGRFPHRNKALDRETTAEEAQFLTQPNSSF